MHHVTRIPESPTNAGPCCRCGWPLTWIHAAFGPHLGKHITPGPTRLAGEWHYIPGNGGAFLLPSRRQPKRQAWQPRKQQHERQRRFDERRAERTPEPGYVLVTNPRWNQKRHFKRRGDHWERGWSRLAS